MPKSTSTVSAHLTEHYTHQNSPEPEGGEHLTIRTQEGYSIFKKPNSSSWCVRFSPPGQKQFRQSLKTSDRDEALRRAYPLYLKIMAKAEAGLLVRKTTVNDVLDEWVAKTTLRAPELSVINRYFREYLGPKDVTTINAKIIHDFKEWRKTYWTKGPGKEIDYLWYERAGRKLKRPVKHEEPKPSTVHTLEVILSKFLTYCDNASYIAKAPKFTKDRVRTSVRPSFNPQEIKIIDMAALTNAQRWYRFDNPKYLQEMHDAQVLSAYINVMAGSGLRPTECLRLRWRDILHFNPEPKKNEVGKIRIQVHGKGKHRVMVPLDSVEIALRGLWYIYTKTCERKPTPDDFVWVYRNMAQFKTISRPLDVLLRELKMKFDYKGDKRDAYSFRHYYITSQLVAGVDIHLLARNCGTSVGIIERHYSHVTTEDGADKLRPQTTRI